MDTWENNRRNQTVKMYIHLQMFNSSPLKDAFLEDDPASFLRDGTLLKTNMAGWKITMFKRRYCTSSNGCFSIVMSISGGLNFQWRTVKLSGSNTLIQTRSSSC